jgi:RNA polymerase sigma-70 factor (sigma-E family)
MFDPDRRSGSGRSDVEVTTAVGRGPVGFEEFVTARLPALLAFAVVLSGDRGLAEDLVQDALVRSHSRWARIVAMEQPEAYIRRIITNGYLSWRRRAVRVVLRPVLPERASDAPDIATTQADRDALRAELALLPRRQRAVLVLRYYAGLSDAQIADVLDCRPATVRAHAARALAALRVTLTGAPIDAELPSGKGLR